ncbi:MAG: Ribosomal small subunit methyltransferase [Chlorobi bacterium]|nr:Ribosomal small subunit methyltransferase [Chlorobiota bacterium]
MLERPQTPADLTISRFFAANRYLGSHDRGFISDAVYGTLRELLRLEFILGDFLTNAAGERYVAILLYAFFTDRGDPIDDATARELLGLSDNEINHARRLLRDAPARIDALPETERIAVTTSLPTWFVERVLEQMGTDEGEALLGSLSGQAPITLRANTLVAGRERLAAALAAQNIPSTPGLYAPDALLLNRRLNANAIPEFKQGWFEIQDEGSQLLSTILDPHPNWHVFDACAGAGGKSLHLAAIMKGRGSISAHDINERRLMEIRPRLRRSTAQNIRVMSHDHYLENRKKLAGMYDAVMIDAPCSGAGVLRRNPGARLTFQPEMVNRLTEIQGTILHEYSWLVKPGGLLLYATCSLLREENEAQVERFLAGNTGWRHEPVNAPEGMITSEGYFRSFPHLHGTDAFFGALLRRK